MVGFFFLPLTLFFLVRGHSFYWEFAFLIAFAMGRPKRKIFSDQNIACFESKRSETFTDQVKFRDVFWSFEGSRS